MTLMRPKQKARGKSLGRSGEWIHCKGAGEVRDAVDQKKQTKRD
jgi:hypothetical protein